MTNDTLSIQRAQAADLPDAVLRAECERRGWDVIERVPFETVYSRPLPHCTCRFCTARREVALRETAE